MRHEREWISGGNEGFFFFFFFLIYVLKPTDENLEKKNLKFKI